MRGQWIGRTTGDIEGLIIINIDNYGNQYIGEVYVFPDNQEEPPSAGFFKTKDKSSRMDFKAVITSIDPRTGTPGMWEVIKKYYPSITNYSKEADVIVHFNKNKLHLKAKTDIGIKIESEIIRKQFTTDSDVEGDTKSWEEYKSFVSSLLGQKNLFRGQRERWKLRTAFHRRRRYCLTRFRAEDIHQLRRQLSARTPHLFNLNNPDEFGAFLNLAQNHGYPTPLLDWTRSPYVAAFFAFKEVPKNAKEKDFVRIYFFNEKKWRTDWRQVYRIDSAALHLSVLETLAIGNERLIPQQSVTTVTNIDDIELYIRSKEIESGSNYLTAINLPVSERNIVMEELFFMGITAASMFPGLDGACEELREKMFDE